MELFNKEEREFLQEVFSTFFEDALGKNVSGEYIHEVIMLDTIAEKLGV